MLYALSTLFLQSVQNLGHKRNMQLIQFLNIVFEVFKEKKNILEINAAGHTLPVFTQVRLKRL